MQCWASPPHSDGSRSERSTSPVERQSPRSSGGSARSAAHAASARGDGRACRPRRRSACSRQRAARPRGVDEPAPPSTADASRSGPGPAVGALSRARDRGERRSASAPLSVPVHRLDLGGVLLGDRLALELHRRRQLVAAGQPVARDDREPLDLLDARELGVGARRRPPAPPRASRSSRGQRLERRALDARCCAAQAGAKSASSTISAVL